MSNIPDVPWTSQSIGRERIVRTGVGLTTELSPMCTNTYFTDIDVNNDVQLAIVDGEGGFFFCNFWHRKRVKGVKGKFQNSHKTIYLECRADDDDILCRLVSVCCTRRPSLSEVQMLIA